MGFWGHTCVVVGSSGRRAASQLLEVIERLSRNEEVWMPSGALARIEGSEVVTCSLGRHGADDRVVAALSRAVDSAALVSIRIGDSDVGDVRLVRDGQIQAAAVLGYDAWEHTWPDAHGPKPDASLVNAEAWIELLAYSVTELAEIVDGSYGFVEEGVARLLDPILDHHDVIWMTPWHYTGEVRHGVSGERVPPPEWLVDIVSFEGSTVERAQGPPSLVFAPMGRGLPYTGTVSGKLPLLVPVFNTGGAGRGLRVLVGGDAVESGFVIPTSADTGTVGVGPEREESDPPSQTNRGVQFDWPGKELPADVIDERHGANNWLSRIINVFVLCETTTSGAAELWIEVSSPDNDDEPPLRVEGPIVVDERLAHLPDDIEARRRLHDEITRPHRRTVPQAFHGPFLTPR